MRRLFVLALVAPLLVLTATAPAHAAPQCHGQDATVVGTPGGTATGTPGDDVIVTEGALTVDALDGHDLVCVTGTAGSRVSVDAGDGDDTVDNTAGTTELVALLGRGVDTFTGGPGSEVVSTGAGNDSGETVSTAGGRDFVSTGRNGQPMNNAISLGDARDGLILTGLPGTGTVDGGPSRDSLQIVDRTHAEWFIDNRKQKVTVDDTTMPLAAMEQFLLSGLRWEFLRFTGGAVREELDVHKFTMTHPDGGVLVDLGGGKDRLTLGPLTSGLYHGGAEADRLVVLGDPRPEPVVARIGVDLLQDLLRIGSGDEQKATSFSDVTLTDVDRALVVGHDGPNKVQVRGCRATVRAGGGADKVVFDSSKTSCSGSPASRAVSAHGEGGPDVLVGSIGDDFLMGGAGNDTARGGPGRDICSAESIVSC
jgi:Ca2+-binding RTX toxin-like protein